MDTPNEWLEVSGPTVEVAVSAALAEFGLDSVDKVKVDVIQEGKRGVLGLGGREAIVKVSVLPKQPRRRGRRSGRSSGESDSGDQQTPQASQGGRGQGGHSGARSKPQQGSRRGGSQQRSDRGGRANQRGDDARSQGGDGATASSRQAGSDRVEPGQRGDRPRSRSGDRSRRAVGSSAGDRTENHENTTKDEAMPTADIGEQATVAREFLEGLLDAFGLEGTVTTRIDDDILYLDVDGEQTEALVGARGTIMTSVLEITRTVVQRKTFGAPRMRIDIAGYGARRREALTIYAGKLADQVKTDDSEVMLEPMNPADRKVVHDAIGEIDGVRSFSEGEDPNRAVVISAEG